MTSNAPRPERARVAVFAKAPVAGEVKTRLAGVLGLEGAAGLHAGLVRHALATALAARVGPVELWCTPDASHPFFARCATEFGAALHVQEGEDLGARMERAAAAALAAGDAVVIIGADCPALAAADLRAAAAAVRDHDVAIAPAEDGGYVMLALSAPQPIFHGIEWGTGRVMNETRRRLAAGAVAWRELPGSWDVDRPEDYARLQREGLLREVLS
jgi:rSAM/selenodomain-associated transferase 1